MLAALVPRYGPPSEVELGNVPVPALAHGQVLVRVRAASINPLDAKLRSGALRPFLRLSFPAILGFDLAGEIEHLGPGVSGLAPGDRVYGRTDARAGGTHAELAAVAAMVLDRIPRSLSFDQAASLPLAAMTAIQALRQATLRKGQRVLINGAAGGVGIAAVQVGRAMGAEVTGVCSGASAPLVTRLGAHRVLDYTRGELEQVRERFDVIFDTVANRPWRDFARILERRGTYITTGFSPGLAVRSVLGRVWSSQRVTFVQSRADGDLMRAVSALVDEGTLVPVIDSSWPLSRMAEAYERIETGHAHGKVVVTIP